MSPLPSTSGARARPPARSSVTPSIATAPTSRRTQPRAREKHERRGFVRPTMKTRATTTRAAADDGQRSRLQVVRPLIWRLPAVVGRAFLSRPHIFIAIRRLGRPHQQPTSRHFWRARARRSMCARATSLDEWRQVDDAAKSNTTVNPQRKLN